MVSGDPPSASGNPDFSPSHGLLPGEVSARTLIEDLGPLDILIVEGERVLVTAVEIARDKVTLLTAQHGRLELPPGTILYRAVLR